MSEERPYWKRLIDEATRARPDLAYKFKSSAEAAAQTMSGSPDQPAPPAPTPPDISYTDSSVLPGRPTHPFEVRQMLDGSVRCYKGLILDAGNRNFSSFLQGTIVQPLKIKKRVNLRGTTGSTNSDQKDFVPSNWNPGPEQQNYSEYENPLQTSFIPSYRGIGTGGGVSTGGDPTPDTTLATFGTGTCPIGKDSFEGGGVGAYYSWSGTGMIRLFCYDDGDPSTRKWGIWGNNGAPTNLGTQGFFILIAQWTGAVMTQFLKSDIVVVGGGGGSHPFKVTAVGDTISVTAGTVNNITIAAGDYEGGGDSWVYMEYSFDETTGNWTGQPEVYTYGSAQESDDETLYVLIAFVEGDQVNQYVTGSMWVDRMQMGDSPAMYYVARI